MAGQETVNVQFMNQAFVDKLDQGLTKEASVASSAFIRQYLREEGFARKILQPVMVTSADLDRQLTEEPTIIVEKEPDSIAASLPFMGRGEIRYFNTPRYAVKFYKVESNEFKKSKFELATYRTDIRTVLQENSGKDLQTQEDTNLYNNVLSVATAAGNVVSVSGGFSVPNLMNGIKNLQAKKLPVGTILMTHEMYSDLLKQPATQLGSGLASSLTSGQASLDNFFGYKIILTNKSDLVPHNQAIVFAPQQYLGQMYLLQDATVFVKTEADIISFKSYESVGMGLGNVNGAVVLNF